MKTIALTVLAVLSVALGVLYAQEKSHSRQQAVRLAELEARVNRQSAELQTQTQQVTSLGEEKKRLTAKAEATKQKLIAAREAAQIGTAQAPADAATAAEDEAAKAEKAAKDAAASKGNPLKGYMAGVAKMMKDPAMKQMLRSSQSTAVRQMYGDLVKQWGIPPEAASKFYDLLLDKQMDTIDRSMSASESGSIYDAQATALVASTADFDAQFKAVLGDNYFQQYKDYEKTVPDRMMLNPYQQRLSADNAPALTAEQSQFLIRTMGEARQSQATSGDSIVNSFQSKDGSFAVDQTAMDKFMRQQASINEQVAQRAAGVLSAQQLDSFKQYQQQMLDMQRAGMEMAAKMNNGGNP